MNMSYCRFQNTVTDFRYCANALEEMENGNTDGGSALSQDELSAAKTLSSEALDLVLRLAESVGKDIADMDDADIRAAIDEIQARAVKADYQEKEEA